jgi:alpha-galactosidase
MAVRWIDICLASPLLFALLLLAVSADPAGAAPGGVAIRQDGTRVTLDTGALALQLDRAAGGALRLLSLKQKQGGVEWAAPGAPAGIDLTSALVTADGLPPGIGFRHTGCSTHPAPHGGTELRLDIEHAGALRASLRLTAYPGSPVLDLCLQLTNTGRAPFRNLSRFDPLSLPLACPEKPYRAYWVTRNAYALHSAEVDKTLVVDGGNWNGPEAAGWLALEDTARSAFLVAGIEWERHWQFRLQRSDASGAPCIRLSAGLARACTQDLPPGATLESPHLFLGVAQGDLDDAANVTRDYLQTCVLPPMLSGFPYVCYDIWSTEGEDVEARILDEARFAAEKLGVEVFYHDASWYRDSDTTGKERWGVGLGSYTEDRRKFPQGLRHLADTVHGLGMKFGLWVCPEMVDTTVMAREKLPDLWMTQAGGKFNLQEITGWNPMKMLCLGDPDAEAHIRESLLRLVSDYRLDWLKWDASGLPGLDIVCDRADHGHQAGNGSQAAVAGKYRILDALHQRYPDLILEQCSYGTRLDYGMGRHGSRANWLSDSTAPSSHVRDNVMAAAYVFPGSYNMTWIMRDEEVTKPQTPVFLDTMFRSRMMGSFGFGTLHGSLSERVSLYPPEVIAAAARNVRNYKRYRHLLSQRCYHLTPPGRENDWQGMQFAARDGGEAVVCLFRNGSETAARRFPLRGLDPRRAYTITRLNTGATESASGAALMQAGIEVTLAREPQESEILMMKAQAGASAGP